MLLVFAKMIDGALNPYRVLWATFVAPPRSPSRRG